MLRTLIRKSTRRFTSTRLTPTTTFGRTLVTNTPSSKIIKRTITHPRPNNNNSNRIIACHKNNPHTRLLMSPHKLHYTNSPPTHHNDIHSQRHQEAIQKFAMRRSNPATLEQIIAWSTPQNVLSLGQFVWEELPVRIAHRVTELSSLPYGLSEMKSIKQLRHLYSTSFHSFAAHPKPLSLDSPEMASFEEMLEHHVSSLGAATVLLANGIRERMIQVPEQADMIADCPFLNDFLDRFHASRIGTRLITGQFVAVYRQLSKGDSMNSGIRGLIDDECNPHTELNLAADAAARLCWDNYHVEPQVDIIYETENRVTFKYVPSFLHYILFELLKNSMRATAEYHREQNGGEMISEDDMPPIEVVISNGEHDITIKMSDQGGGISREDMAKIWLYSFTSVPQTVTEEIYASTLREGDSGAGKPPMAGMGYGLPLSRLHARYFGGDVQVISMHGYGTDVYVYLNKLENTLEPLNYAYQSAMSSLR